MYERLPENDEPDAFGLTRADFTRDDVVVWPENWDTYVLFASLQTQWRAGGFGLIGLDYNTLFHKMDRMKLSAEDYEQLEADIRVMEYAALAEMSPKQD